MRDQIHTIPVLDALRQPGNCPFCAMHSKLDRDAVQFIIGPAYMEDDIRMETNRRGFCAAHLSQMYEQQNRLGLGLMLHTFMQQLNKDAAATQTQKSAAAGGFRFGKPKPVDTPDVRLRARLAQTQSDCYLCARVEETFARYMDTFFSLWQHDKDAVALTEAVPGYCLPHFTAMLAAAEDKLSNAKRERFCVAAIEKQLRFMKQMEEDLEWFTLKFDYRHANEPWGNAKDAVPRAMALIHGGMQKDD